MLIEEEIKQQDKGHIIETDPDLFEATRIIFEKAGLSELDHLMWRERQMRTACRVEYMRIFEAMNPGFIPEDGEPESRSRPYKIPSTSRKQLEVAAADEFARHRTTYILANSSPNKDANTTEAESGQTEDQRTDAASITHDDLEKEELTDEEVVDRYLSATMSRSSTNDKERQKYTLVSNLRQAAYRALKKIKAGTVNPPARVSLTQAGNWWNVAVVKKGTGGANGGNKYRFIRACAHRLSS